MRQVKVQAPAKINLTLDVIGRREDGFHDIKSIMHTISLFDYLTVKIEEAEGLFIELSGNSDEIPYDSSNLVWKAADRFFVEAGIQNIKLSVYIEKNIPVAAGMAGGSSDAAAVLAALNHLFNDILSKEKINQICASLGSDLNFCLVGGCAICSSRGEKVRRLPYLSCPVSVVKPRHKFISAKEAFDEFDRTRNQIGKEKVYTDEMIPHILRGSLKEDCVCNDLQEPLSRKYLYISHLRYFLSSSVMTGSGPTFFVLRHSFDNVIFEPEEFICYENLQMISHGVKILKEEIAG